MEALIARITDDGPSAKRPPHMELELELLMRSAIALVLAAAVLTGGCDRQSPGAAQANQTSTVNVSADEVPPPSPDEVGGGAPSAAPKLGAIDTSHAGTAAPTWSFGDPAGKPVTLAAYKGRPVLVNLWATWCAPCVAEMPTLDALAKREAGKLQVIAISQDNDAAKVAAFWTKGGYTTLQPSLDTKLAFSAGLGVNLPTTILYDSAGKEVWRVSGSREWADAETTKALAAAR